MTVECEVGTWQGTQRIPVNYLLHILPLQGSRCDEEITAFWIILRRVVKLSSLKLFNP